MRRARALPVAAYLLVVGMSAFGHWRIYEDDLNDKAARCVSAWETRADIRDAVETATTAGAEALISAVPNASAEQVAAYRAAVTEQAGIARGQIADPDCDLGAAQRRLR